MKIKVTDICWNEGSYQTAHETTVEIPADTPPWRVIVEVRLALIDKFGEAPYAYNY